MKIYDHRYTGGKICIRGARDDNLHLVQSLAWFCCQDSSISRHCPSGFCQAATEKLQMIFIQLLLWAPSKFSAIAQTADNLSAKLFPKELLHKLFWASLSFLLWLLSLSVPGLLLSVWAPSLYFFQHRRSCLALHHRAFSMFYISAMIVPNHACLCHFL